MNLLHVLLRRRIRTQVGRSAVKTMCDRARSGVLRAARNAMDRRLEPEYA